MARTSTDRRRRGGARKPSSASPPPPEAAAAAPALPAPPVEVPLSTPEPGFAARVPAPAPERPLPSRRRAIFFDIENTSRAEHIARMIDHLAIDRAGRRTEFVAVGNWRVIGADTARLLARHGAHLVHSAPSTGVKDWSDLRIAVSAGVWLGGARPGDVIEIVSDDRAFDAVGDVAATLGVEFHRRSYRALSGAPVAAAPEEAEEEAPGRSRLRGGRGRRRRRRGGAAQHAVAAAAPREHAAPRGHEPARRAHEAPPRAHEPARSHEAGRPHAAAAGREPGRVHEPAPPLGGAPHTAPHDEIVGVVRELVRGSPSGAVLIDTLANALKARGFSRPPGSPRLITRLRRIRELSVSPTGMIGLLGPGRTDGGEPAGHERVAEAAGAPPAETAGAAPRRRRRRSRGRGRGRRQGRPGSVPAAG